MNGPRVDDTIKLALVAVAIFTFLAWLSGNPAVRGRVLGGGIIICIVLGIAWYSWSRWHDLD